MERFSHQAPQLMDNPFLQRPESIWAPAAYTLLFGRGSRTQTVHF
jgi:hypothetical protein